MKKPIAQIVDSAGSIPRELLEKYNISEVAFHIHFDQQQYRENININSQELYERMKKQPRQVLKTAVPGISDWIQAFEKKYKDGYQSILVTTIARPLSASAESAVAAASAFMQLHPEINIQVLESNTCACGQAALEIKIAQLIEQQQLSLEDLVQYVSELLPEVVSLFSVNELTYMHAGGRIGGAASLLGKLVQIKPVCEFIGGVVHLIKPVRCRKKAMELLVDEAVKRVKHIERTVICVQHALCEEEAEFLIAQLQDKLNFQGPIYLSPVGAVVGSHSGPGSIGIGMVEG